MRLIPALSLPPPPVFLPRRSLSLFRRDELARRKHRHDSLRRIERWLAQVNKSKALVKLLAQTVDFAASAGAAAAAAAAAATSAAASASASASGVHSNSVRPYGSGISNQGPAMNRGAGESLILSVQSSTSLDQPGSSGPPRTTERASASPEDTRGGYSFRGRPPPSPMRGAAVHHRNLSPRTLQPSSRIDAARGNMFGGGVA